MPIFLWGDDNELRWKHLKHRSRVLSTERAVPREVNHEELDHDANGYPCIRNRTEVVMEEVPDPTEWVQTSRQFRGVTNVETGEHRDLGRETFALFKERGGTTTIGLDYELRPVPYPFKKGDRDILTDAAEDHGEALKRSRVRGIWAPVGIWAHVGALFRFMFSE